MSHSTKLPIKIGDVFCNYSVKGETKKWVKNRFKQYFICICVCGNEVLMTAEGLRAKKKDKCCCNSRKGKYGAFESVKVGDLFGDWEIIGKPYSKQYKMFAECKCTLCGNCKPVDLQNIVRGQSKCCLLCSRRAHVFKLLKKNFENAKCPQDLIGRTIGKRLILDYALLKTGYHYKTKCICGQTGYIRQGRILRNEAISCRNCIRTELADIGTIIGKRTITGVKNINGKRVYIAICECGNIAEGSLNKFKNRELCMACSQRKGLTRKVILGYPDKSVMGIWNHIFDRCYNKNNKSFVDYGGRGIKVHPRYFDMQNFVDDLGPRPTKEHSLDRIDPDGDYAPGNIRWATHREQIENRRCGKKYKGMYIKIKKTDLCETCLKKLLTRSTCTDDHEQGKN